MFAHADTIARERFSAGYDLWEVQTLFNVLEEVVWNRILKELPPGDFAEAIGLVSTAPGTGKDTLAGKARVSTLYLQSLFTGTESPE